MANILFPVVCDNPQCKVIFFDDNSLAISGGITATLERCKVGPCPRCGSMASIPDGVYSEVDTRIKDPSLAARVEMALNILKHHTQNPTSMEALQKDLSAADIPSALWKPANFDELCKMIGVLVLVLQLCYKIYTDQAESAPPVSVSLEMKEVIEMLLKSEEDSADPQPTPPAAQPPAPDSEEAPVHDPQGEGENK